MKKVLLLGGAGFIGLNITKFLAQRGGYNITIIDNFFRGKMDDQLQSLQEEYSLNILNTQKK